jgi:hypothetical protein
VLRLQFEHPASREVLSVGPAPYFVVRGAALLAGPGEEPVGFYEDGLWHAAGRSFTAIRPDGPTAVQFQENGSRGHSDTLGPFENVMLVDGAIRHGPRLGRLLAKFDDESQTWLVYPSRKKCHAAVLSPAGVNGGTAGATG